MKIATPTKSREFSIRDPDNLIQVEEGEDGVLVRAAMDNISPQRKAAFIRELAAEGFIADKYQWYDGGGLTGHIGVTWVIDRSWVMQTPMMMRRKAAPIILGMIGIAGFLLVLLSAVLILQNRL
jgi:hypothetical protein